jgi:hypothetical protein
VTESQTEGWGGEVGEDGVGERVKEGGREGVRAGAGSDVCVCVRVVCVCVCVCVCVHYCNLIRTEELPTMCLQVLADFL